MAQKNHTSDITELLQKCVAQSDPMLSMLEGLYSQLIEAEAAEKSQRTDCRSGYHSGYRPRWLGTRMETLYLLVPKVCQGGYISIFVTNVSAAKLT